MKSVPAPVPVPKTLDELLANAAAYAEFCMRESGDLTPAMLFIGAGGVGMMSAGRFTDEASKDAFVQACRFVCIAHDVSACVIALEAWITFGERAHGRDFSERPSEAIDRQEHVVLIGESREGHRTRFLPIVRSDSGAFFGLGAPDDRPFEVRGRFSGMLPRRQPQPEEREIARQMLLLMTGGAPQGRRPRR